MKARLVQLDGRRRVGVTRLEDVPVTIGRDLSCDVVVEGGRISRKHARIEMLGGLHYLLDLDSANGTRHGGRALEGRTPLEPGDEFSLADEVHFRYEGESEIPWAWVGGAVAIAATLVVAVLLFQGRHDAVWEESVRLAAEALEADARGDSPVAQQRLRAAVGLLLREGRLDDVPRGEVVEVAMRRLGEELGGGVDLEAIFRHRPPPEPVALEAEDPCRLDVIGVDDFDRCLREQVVRVMTGLRQDPTKVPERFYGEVARRLRIENSFLSSSLERGQRYREMMVEELQRAYMPPLLHYLACIESGYRTRARSKAGAVGLWQFMPGTARDYGLRIGGEQDERTDPRRSTVAAARYLRSLAFEFGGESLMLVLASYNRGENAVRRSLKKLEDPYSDRSYWALVDAGHLPEETAVYVSRFVAAAVAGEAGLPSDPVLRAAGY